MHLRKSALNAMILTSLVLLAALILALLGPAPRFDFGAASTVSFPSLLWAVLACVALSFLFGWARYDLAAGLALCVAMLHDQLLSLALTTLLSVLFGLNSVMPAMAVAGAAFTFLFSIPVLREARTIARNTSLRDMSREGMAETAVKNTHKAALLTTVVVLLGLLAFLVSGNLSMTGAVLPLITGFAASLLSRYLITPYVWAVFAARRKSGK